MASWLKRLGLVGLAFFTLKGLMWLIAGAVILNLVSP